MSIHSCSNATNCNCPKISIAKKTKYLGIILDCNPKWNFHVNNLIVKLRSLIFKFHKLKYIISTYTMRVAILSLYQFIMQW